MEKPTVQERTKTLLKNAIEKLGAHGMYGYGFVEPTTASFLIKNKAAVFVEDQEVAQYIESIWTCSDVLATNPAPGRVCVILTYV